MAQDPHGLAAAYALGALDANDAAAFEQHLDQCAECRDELASFSTVIEALSETDDAQQPQVPASLSSRISAEIASTPQVARTDASNQSPDTPVTSAAGGGNVVSLDGKRGRRLGAVLTAAASVVVLAAVAVGLLVSRDSGDNVAADVQRILDAPDATAHSLGVGDAKLYVSIAEGGVVVEGDMPSLPAEKTYQLWVVPADGGAPVAGPTMDGGHIDAAWYTPLDKAGAVAVSIEPQGGSATPTDVAVAVNLA